MEPVDLRSERAGRVAAVTGVASALLLAAAAVLVHEWTPTAIALVAAWGVATASAFGTAIFALWHDGGSRRLAKLGLALALVSATALGLAGVAFAAGLNDVPGCGGG